MSRPDEYAAPVLDRAGGPVAVIGATGYVGGRLVPLLLEKGWKVRAVARSERKLHCRPYAGHPNLEIQAADAGDFESLQSALEGCQAAYYLVHSMLAAKDDYAQADRYAARNMAKAAHKAGLKRVVYLGGLTPEDPNLSRHLRSRAEVADILLAGPVPATALKAGIILGSGSASFELLRYLVDRLPVMLTPRWVRTEAQPISIRDVLAYLADCLDHPRTAGRSFDICGPFIETYDRLFRLYAREAGLPRRLILPMPLLTPWLSSHWLGLVTPIPINLARPLIMGLRNRVVCRENDIRQIIPRELTDCRTAIRRALEKIEQHVVDTSWSDAGGLTPPEWVAVGDASYAGGSVLETAYRVRMNSCPEEIWDRITSIGGDTGWYFGNALWGLRGWLDALLGGVGLRRGRRDPKRLAVGDALDFWRVLDVVPPERLLLLAEMKLPGEALLEFRAEQSGRNSTELSMRAMFLPRGLGGLVYWYAVYPLHGMIFKGMIKRMARSASCRVLDGPSPLKEKGYRCTLSPPEDTGKEKDA